MGGGGVASPLPSYVLLKGVGGIGQKNGRDHRIAAVCILHNLKCQTVGGEVMMMPDRVVLIGGILTSSCVRCSLSLPLAVL